MLYREDMERERSVWVDRGIDDRVDRFQPCEICDAILRAKALEDKVWQELHMCFECNVNFLAQAIVTDVFGGERPINLDREPETITSNKARENDGPRVNSLYFLPDGYMELDDHYSGL